MDTAWPLVGRDEQLRVISARMRDDTSAGVVLAGAPGLGKTRLAAEALRRAQASGRATAWVVATQAAASIPFGPFAHLLSDTEADSASRLDLLRHASRALAERGRGRPLVLGVDDAHLLDQASAALIHHLATTTGAFVVATVRAGEPAPDAVAALWKHGLAVRLELTPLHREEVTALVEAAVDGQIDGATLDQLWQLSEGNALFLRELLTAALDSGALVLSDGVWRAGGPLTTSTLLAEVVQARLGGLHPQVRDVAETVAIGEPLGATLLEAVVSPDALAEADRAGLLEILPDPRRMSVRLAHPLYGELLRAGMTPLRARMLRRQLADALQTTGANRRDDLLRTAVWQLEAGAPPKPSLLVDAARRASVSFFDHPLAERLAAAAVDAGGGFSARLALAEALHARGRVEQAESLLGVLEQDAQEAGDKVRVALVRANNLLRGLGDLQTAEAVIGRAERLAVDPRWRDELAVLRGTVAIYQGQPQQASAAVSRVLTRSGAGPSGDQALVTAAGPRSSDAADRVVLRALAVATIAAAYRGRVSEVTAATRRAIDLLRRGGNELSLTADRVLTMQAVARQLAGQLDEAEQLANDRYQVAIARRADDLRASWALTLGQCALARGVVETAVRWLREAVVLLREHSTMLGSHGLAWGLGSLAQAAALLGDTTRATKALNELDRVIPDKSYVPDRELSRAWLAAAHGHHAQAQAHAAEAARDAARRQAEAFEAVALHDLARLGAPDAAAGRLAELGAVLEGPLAPLYSGHAAALVQADAAELDHLADAFYSLGATLLAAEAAAEAADLHRRAGRDASAVISAGKANRLAEQCQGARTPALQRAGHDPDPLTPREREIAALAAQGRSSRDIADQLVVSVRTVDNHLHKAYAKLGVTARADLGDVL